MSEQVGVVKWMGGKTIKGRTYYSFNLVDVDGFFRCGQDEPQIKKGDMISFSYETDQWGDQVDKKSIVVLDEVKEEVKAAAPVKKQSGGTAVGRDDYWANKEAADVDRQKIISLQAATNIATNIVTAALAADALSLPAKKAEKFDALLAMVEQVADDLVVRYVNAPAHIDELVAGAVSKPKQDNNNYGSELDDE